MAHTHLLQRVFTEHNSPMATLDEAGNIEQRGVMVMGIVNVTSYINPGGLPFTARELGLSSIYGMAMWSIEGVMAVANGLVFRVEGADAADGMFGVTGAGENIVVSASTLANPPAEVANAVDIGMCMFIAFGEVERFAENI